MLQTDELLIIVALKVKMSWQELTEIIFLEKTEEK